MIGKKVFKTLFDNAVVAGESSNKESKNNLMFLKDRFTILWGIIIFNFISYKLAILCGFANEYPHETIKFNQEQIINQY